MRRGIWYILALLVLAGAQIAPAQQASQSTPAQPPAPNSTKPAAVAPAKPDSATPPNSKPSNDTKPAAKPAVVFSNDNLPQTTPGSISVVGKPGDASISSASSHSGVGNQRSPEEKEWRQKFATAREKLQHDQEQIPVLKDELAQLASDHFDEDQILKKQKEIFDMQKQLQVDRQAISDLEDALRKAGGDPAWAK